MKELTEVLPKPMLRVQGRPILEHILEGILAAGIREVFIVTGHRAEIIEQYFGDGSKWNARIECGRQTVQDGTGKAPEVAKDFVGCSPFILTYGDILVRRETYKRMVSRFNEAPDLGSNEPGHGYSGVVTVTRGEDVRHGGLNFFDEQFCLRQVVEKPTTEQLEELRKQGWLKPNQGVWYNAGIYLFNPSLFEFTARLKKSARNEYELTDAINALLAAGHKLAGFEIEGRWVDVRDPAILEELQSGGTLNR